MKAAAPVAGASPAAQGLAATTVLGALFFNAALCGVNTNLARITEGTVMAAEIGLVGLALLLVLRRDATPFLALSLLVSYAVLLMSLRGAVDLKALRDFLIPVVFYLLGRRCGDLRLVDRVAFAGGAIVVAIGLFEFLALPTYVRIFNVAAFYSARDNVAAAAAAAGGGLSASKSALFESGFRYDARTILPFLGPHRASSVFLEPVTMGNFGALLALWGMFRRGACRRWPTVALGVACIVLADARFGLAVFLAGCVLLRLAPAIRTVHAFALPFLLMAAFAIYGALSAEVHWTNDFAGRMLWSARLLVSLDVAAVWGLSLDKPFLSDSGYAYSLNQFGLAGLGGVWAAFILAPSRTGESWRFACCLAAFVSLLLVVSGSIFSIKVAGLLWFIAGANDRGMEEVTVEQQPRLYAQPAFS